MGKPNRVVIRTYCETNCDCPNCHTGYAKGVENCVYCQLKWAGKGEYNLKWRKENDLPPTAEYKPSRLKEVDPTDNDVLQEIIDWWKEL